MSLSNAVADGKELDVSMHASSSIRAAPQVHLELNALLVAWQMNRGPSEVGSSLAKRLGAQTG